MTRIITIVSGRPGAGKTSMTANLAAQLAQRAQRVCVLDADWGATNITRLFGLQPQHSVDEQLFSGVALDLLMQDVSGFDVLPGASASEHLAALEPLQQQRLAGVLAALDDYDFLLIDLASGQSHGLLPLAQASPELIVIISPEPAVLSETYALLKSLHRAGPFDELEVIVNQARNQVVGRHFYDKFREVVNFYLAIQPKLLGIVREDESVPAAASAQQTLADFAPLCVACGDIDDTADALLHIAPGTAPLSPGGFAKRFLAAAGINPAPQTDAVHFGDIGQASDEDDALDALAARIDGLIDELTRLRAAQLSDSGEPSLQATSTGDLKAWLTGLAHHAEQVRGADDTFAIYHYPRPGGETLHFAWHGPGDEMDATGTRSSSS